jgi:DNA-binding CsgD family transcriptional regulator
VRCPILVGREEPTTLAAGAVRRLRAAEGGVLVLTGEAGIGKTRLAACLADAAPGRARALSRPRPARGGVRPAAPGRRAAGGADLGLPGPGREAEVLDLIADRLSNREIAAQLPVSPRAVKKRVAALLAKLGGGERAGLARLARGLR